jgi:hypothetical protein
MPKWDYGTVDGLLRDPKIAEALPGSAKRVGEPFRDTLASLDASPAVKDWLREAVVTPLKSGNVPTIVAWLKAIIGYSPSTLDARMRYRNRSQEDLAELRHGMH